MQYIRDEATVIYQSKDGREEKMFDALEWLAAMCSHMLDKGEQIKALAIERKIVPTTDGWELREEASSYNPFFGAQKVDIDHENTYPLDESVAISMS